jgi:dolichyl-phosphate-mannose-protein mannosyltransferase
VHGPEHPARRSPPDRAGAGAAASVRERLGTLVTVPGLIVATLTGLGIVLRLVVGHQSVFGDEISTYYIVSTNGLGGVISTVHGNGEITPPLYFVLSWLTTRIDLTPELLRAPSLLAGAAAIPLTYLLGSRTVGRGAGLVAAAITALAPYMIFHSAWARSYELMIVLVMLSTLSMLVAIEDRRARWWIAYAAFTCAAVYTHYPAVLVLTGQLLWLLWAHPEARKPALLANVAAVVGFLPWLSGLINDFNSPTSDIASLLLTLTPDTLWTSLQHWSIGYPINLPTTRPSDLPGNLALVLLAVGVATAAGGRAVAWLRERPRFVPLDRGLMLIIVLALSAPAGAVLVSALGRNLIGEAQFAASWPGFALLLAAVLVAATGWLRVVAVALVVASFAIGAAKMLEARFQAPDYEAVASFIDRRASPGDVVIDASGGSPAPILGTEVALDRPLRLFRVRGLLVRYDPFSFSRAPSPPTVASQAVAAAGGRRVFVVTSQTSFVESVGADAGRLTLGGQTITALSSSYRPVETQTYPGIIRLAVRVFEDRASPRG